MGAVHNCKAKTSTSTCIICTGKGSLLYLILRLHNGMMDDDDDDDDDDDEDSTISWLSSLQ
jgi:hypothetical protein